MARAKNPDAYSYYPNYGRTNLCKKCRKEDKEEEDEDDENKIGDNNVFKSCSVTQITSNGKTTTWVNGKKIKERIW